LHSAAATTAAHHTATAATHAATETGITILIIFVAFEA
jgi:hypothetical protein